MTELQQAEKELFELTQKVGQLRKDTPLEEVNNYDFTTPLGKTSLLELFGSKDTLFLIHNMGQGCRYCTLWADGLNGFIPHLENDFAFALVSRDSPETQRTFANSRGWRFQLASHQGSSYLEEQNVGGTEYANYPGLVCYQRKENKIFKKNTVTFGPGDEFCSIWNILGLAGHNAESWTPQFNYWKRPEKLDDGGQNLGAC